MEEVEEEGTALKVVYRPYRRAPPIEIEVHVDGADASKLSRDTIAKLVELAELMAELAEDIEFDNDPTEHGYIHPDGWTAVRYVDETGANVLVVKHRVYESNA